jgi:hypothetical protein
MIEPVIDQYYDPIDNVQIVRLRVPMAYLVRVRRPRYALFWWAVKLAWLGCFAQQNGPKP